MSGGIGSIGSGSAAAAMPKVTAGASGGMKGVSKVSQHQPQGGAAKGVAPAQTMNESIKALNALVKQQKPEANAEVGKSVNVYA